MRVFILCAPSLEAWVKTPLYYGRLDMLPRYGILGDGVEIVFELLAPGKEKRVGETFLRRQNLLKAIRFSAVESVWIVGDNVHSFIAESLKSAQQSRIEINYDFTWGSLNEYISIFYQPVDMNI